ncbi:hypothetical protein CLIM01_13473 [Colletotrichum limetticola]|uniref:Uncharacterized protein n=1 Tax=Colletotrichum limetticola TaxID=1209924 RepID=A0ABQ9PB88_9PEZI|nr:hypothetical protein CLIM01_13473 [Colletotrichum limetticola]
MIQTDVVESAIGLTVHDILYLSPSFWRLHFDNEGPDLAPLLEDLRQFKVCGELMLTGIKHGLDTKNLDTTTTMLEDGSSVLHTPATGAAKAMPPTTALAGIPRVGCLLAKGERQGVKPFIFSLNGSTRLRLGIVSRALPVRPVTKPLGHSITTFNNVELPGEALLGSPAKAKDYRAEYLNQIHRVSVGTLSFVHYGRVGLEGGRVHHGHV